MNKRLSNQNVPSTGTGRPAAPSGVTYPAVESAAETPAGSPAAAQAPLQPVGGGVPQSVPSRGNGQGDAPPSPAPSQNLLNPDDRYVKTEVSQLKPELQELIRKMLVEGSTFEDIVEAVDERGGDGITLIAVQNYFQGDQGIQKKRVVHSVENSEALLACLDEDPESAESRLARATFLTGFARVNRGTAAITPRDAERCRLERANLKLKNDILELQRKKASQDLDYTRARTRLIVLTQGRLQAEISKLEQEVKAHRPGDPLGPQMLQRIQQIYGLASQPILYEEKLDASATA